MNRDDKIIGGMFGLPVTVEPTTSGIPCNWVFLGDSALSLCNARSSVAVQPLGLSTDTFPDLHKCLQSSQEISMIMSNLAPRNSIAIQKIR